MAYLKRYTVTVIDKDKRFIKSIYHTADYSKAEVLRKFRKAFPIKSHLIKIEVK